MQEGFVVSSNESTALKRQHPLIETADIRHFQAMLQHECEVQKCRIYQKSLVTL